MEVMDIETKDLMKAIGVIDTIEETIADMMEGTIETGVSERDLQFDICTAWS